MKQYDNIHVYRRIVKAKLYIDNHFSDNIDLNCISEEAHFSKYHFIRLFKSIYGFTPKSYLIKIRTEQAKKHLANGYSVLETGLFVGLESPTSFTAMFKKATGISPSGYQQQQMQKKIKIAQNPLQFVPTCFAETHGWKNSNF